MDLNDLLKGGDEESLVIVEAGGEEDNDDDDQMDFADFGGSDEDGSPPTIDTLTAADIATLAPLVEELPEVPPEEPLNSSINEQQMLSSTSCPSTVLVPGPQDQFSSTSSLSPVRSDLTNSMTLGDIIAGSHLKSPLTTPSNSTSSFTNPMITSTTTFLQMISTNSSPSLVSTSHIQQPNQFSNTISLSANPIQNVAPVSGTALLSLGPPGAASALLPNHQNFQWNNGGQNRTTATATIISTPSGAKLLLLPLHLLQQQIPVSVSNMTSKTGAQQSTASFKSNSSAAITIGTASVGIAGRSRDANSASFSVVPAASSGGSSSLASFATALPTEGEVLKGILGSTSSSLPVLVTNSGYQKASSSCLPLLSSSSTSSTSSCISSTVSVSSVAVPTLACIDRPKTIGGTSTNISSSSSATTSSSTVSSHVVLARRTTVDGLLRRPDTSTPKSNLSTVLSPTTAKIETSIVRPPSLPQITTSTEAKGEVSCTASENHQLDIQVEGEEKQAKEGASEIETTMLDASDFRSVLAGTDPSMSHHPHHGHPHPYAHHPGAHHPSVHPGHHQMGLHHQMGGGGGGLNNGGGRMTPPHSAFTQGSHYATLTPLQPLPPISTMSDKFTHHVPYGGHHPVGVAGVVHQAAAVAAHHSLHAAAAAANASGRRLFSFFVSI